MKVNQLISVAIGLGLLILVCGCTQAPSDETVSPSVTTPAGIANPSAVYCESKNYTYRIVTNPDGSQAGVCVFPNGKSCDGWAYYRGECNETTVK